MRRLRNNLFTYLLTFFTASSIHSYSCYFTNSLIIHCPWPFPRLPLPFLPNASSPLVSHVSRYNLFPEKFPLKSLKTWNERARVFPVTICCDNNHYASLMYWNDRTTSGHSILSSLYSNNDVFEKFLTPPKVFLQTGPPPNPRTPMMLLLRRLCSTETCKMSN